VAYVAGVVDAGVVLEGDAGHEIWDGLLLARSLVCVMILQPYKVITTNSRRDHTDGLPTVQFSCTNLPTDTAEYSWRLIESFSMAVPTSLGAHA
jgi:hypothetical protein